ncbi:MFS domain-containing protein [Caerostris extrusa]|uniref:MFS domain-containing protein n=1 Tax=Caerostris extrusa TaxID=172846 RepID=A0AAV4VXM0_CAEEX|nr:MFS domain-containing protein [Caerostris extrusa]
MGTGLIVNRTPTSVKKVVISIISLTFLHLHVYWSDSHLLTGKRLHSLENRTSTSMKRVDISLVSATILFICMRTGPIARGWTLSPKDQEDEMKKVDSAMSGERRDQRWCWVIALACCFVNCLLYGVIRLSGLLLVSTVETFQVTRARAAVPFSVATSVRNLSGLFVGFFGQKFGLRPVVGTGCLLAAAGAALCFFVPDMFWFTLCWGGLFGIGCGLGTCLLPHAINQHFDQHRGKASGISYSGSYIGSFIFPPVVVLLLDKYGLPGTFFVISGTLLNGIAASILFPSTSPLTSKSSKNSKEPSEYQLKIERRCSFIDSDQPSTFWQKFLRNFNWPDATLKTQELSKTQNLPSIYLVSIEPSKDLCEQQGSCFSLLKRKSFSNSCESLKTKSLAYISGSFKTSRNRLSKCYSDKFYFNTRNALFKSKYKSSIAKIKKIFLVNVLKKRYSFDFDLHKLPADDVKLLSFKKFNCALCASITEKIIHPKCQLYNVNNNDSIFKNSSSKNLETDFAYLKSLNRLSSETTSECVKEIQNSTGTDIMCPKYENSIAWNVDSNGIGNCNRRISRQNKRHVSFVPSGTQTAQLCAKELQKMESSSDLSSTEPSWHKEVGNCCFDWFRLHAHPMFMVIASTMSFHTFVTVCMITIIEDFAKDLHVPDHQVHYVLMTLSTADLLGALTLGIITDHGIISRCYFIVLCFIGTAVSHNRNIVFPKPDHAFDPGGLLRGIRDRRHHHIPVAHRPVHRGQNQAVALASGNAPPRPPCCSSLCSSVIFEIESATTPESFMSSVSLLLHPVSFGWWLPTFPESTENGISFRVQLPAK